MPDGSTMRDHLMSVARQKRRRVAQLDGPPIPFRLAHVWQWFLELHQARGSNGWGPNAISYGDLYAWSRLTLRLPRPAEIEALFAVDAAFLKIRAADARQDAARRGKAPPAADRRGR